MGARNRFALKSGLTISKGITNATGHRYTSVFFDHSRRRRGPVAGDDVAALVPPIDDVVHADGPGDRDDEGVRRGRSGNADPGWRIGLGWRTVEDPVPRR